MIAPVMELAGGTVDGINRIFTTTAPYRPGSTEVFWSGQAMVKTHSDGWDELGGNQIRMKQAPLPADTILVFYVPA